MLAGLKGVKGAGMAALVPRRPVARRTYEPLEPLTGVPPPARGPAGVPPSGTQSRPAKQALPHTAAAPPRSTARACAARASAGAHAAVKPLYRYTHRAVHSAVPAPPELVVHLQVLQQARAAGAVRLALVHLGQLAADLLLWGGGHSGHSGHSERQSGAAAQSCSCRRCRRCGVAGGTVGARCATASAATSPHTQAQPSRSVGSCHQPHDARPLA
jgi:hypothetical protein